MRTRFIAVALAMALASLAFASAAHAVPKYGQYLVYDSKMNFDPDGNYRWVELFDDEHQNYAGPAIEDPALSVHGGVARAQLPFTFEYYGKKFDKVYIGASGFVGFAMPDYYNWSPTNIPNDYIEYSIAAFWSDLYPFNPAEDSGNGTIGYQTYGTYPNRRFVVEWYYVALGESYTDYVTFECILIEGSNEIVCNYAYMSGPNTLGGSSVVGLNTNYEQSSLEYSAFTSFMDEYSAYEGYTVLFSPHLSQWRPLAGNIAISDTYGMGEVVDSSTSQEVNGMTYVATAQDTTVQVRKISSNDGEEASYYMPSPLDVVYSNIGYMSTIYPQKVFAFNAGQGEAPIVVIYGYYSSYYPSKVDQGSGGLYGSRIWVGRWNGSNWEEVGYGSLGANGIVDPNNFYLEACSSSFDYSNGKLGVAFVASSFGSENLYYTEYYDGSWIAVDNSLDTLGITGFASSAQAIKENRKKDMPAALDGRALYCALAYGPGSEPWILYSYYPGGFYNRLSIVRHFDGWNDQSMNFEFPTWCSDNLSLAIAGNQVLAFVTVLGSEGNTNYFYPILCSDATAEYLQWNGLSMPYTGFGECRPYCMFDFKNRPVVLTTSSSGMEGGFYNLTVWRYEDSNWAPLSMNKDFGGLAYRAWSIYAPSIAPDQVGNPMVAFELYGPESYNGIMLLFRYEIDMKVPEDLMYGPAYIVHKQGVNMTTNRVDFGFTEGGIDVQAHLSGPAADEANYSTEFWSGETFYLDIYSYERMAGEYPGFLSFQATGVRYPPMLGFSLLKHDYEVVRNLYADGQDEFEDQLYDAVPGDVIVLAPGDYYMPEMESMTNGLTIIAELTDTVTFTDGLYLYGSIYINFVGILFTNIYDYDTDFVDIEFTEGLPGYVHFTNCLLNFNEQGGFYVWGNGMIVMDFCTFHQVYYWDKPASRKPWIYNHDNLLVEAHNSIIDMDPIGDTYSKIVMDFCAYSSDADIMGFVEMNQCYPVDDFGFADPYSGDFHLVSEAGYWCLECNDWDYSEGYTSELLDKGNPVFGVGSEPQPNNSLPNLGAYGRTEHASMSPWPTENYSFDLPSGRTLHSYQIICPPAVPTTSYTEYVNDILSQLGDYDPYKYRVFIYDAQEGAYLELPDVYELRPGMA
ncbi:MAG: hypothetical protein WC712_12710, partial [Candidatus Brocadiia bacterium]